MLLPLHLFSTWSTVKFRQTLLDIQTTIYPTANCKCTCAVVVPQCNTAQHNTMAYIFILICRLCLPANPRVACCLPANRRGECPQMQISRSYFCRSRFPPINEDNRVTRSIVLVVLLPTRPRGLVYTLGSALDDDRSSPAHLGSRARTRR